MFKKKKMEEYNVPYLLLGSEAYLIDDASISSALQRHNKPINIDMISDLPDNILHHILSFLRTKTAIRTSVLSKRWRYLWTYLPVFSFLIFDDYLPKNLNPSSYSLSLLDVLATLLDKSKHHLVVKKRLIILIPRVSLDEHKITSLITSLLGLKVQHLKFLIQDTKYLNTNCVLPTGFSASHSLSKLTLKLGGYTLYIPSGIQFPSLKWLKLYYATFANEEAVEQFFSGCPVLEELSLNYCYWLYIKQITIAILTLRILSIRFDHYCLNCGDDFSKISVKIDVVNLKSLTCISNPSIKFVIVNPLTSMVEAYIAFSSHFHTQEYTKYAKYVSQCGVVLLSALASVKSLTLSEDTIKDPPDVNDHFHLLPEFHNLTHLCLHIDSVFARKRFTQFLLRCPKLEVLVFPLGIYTFTDNHDWTLIPVPGCFKSSLKKLHISRFDGSECEIQYVEFFLENATVLEEFQISLSCWSYSRYNLKNLADLKNRFLGLGSCVIKFRSSEPMAREDGLWKYKF